jgi:hypothetical protein
VPVHVPASTVSNAPFSGVPETMGGAALSGDPGFEGATPAVLADTAVRPPASFDAVTTTLAV